MTFLTVKSYAAVDPITSLTIVPPGALFHTPRVNQGPSRGSWIYNFYATGTSTPQTVYQDGALTTPFAPTGQVTADAFGRFPAIYLDNTVAYKVTLSNAAAAVQQTRDPYNPAMATTGQAQVAAAIGLVINPQGEFTLTEAASGGNAIELSISAGLGGALKIQGITPGLATVVADNTVTTGAQTATFAATNMPGTGYQLTVTATAAPAGATYTGGTLTAVFPGITSSAYTIVLSTGQVILGATFTNGSTAFTTPSTNITGSPSATFTVTFSVGVAGWLPIQCDGVLYYTPIFNATGFTPYTFKGNNVNGQIISASSFTWNGNGNTTLNGAGATASPPTWFTPLTAGIGAGYYVEITKTGGNAGLAFSAATGSFANIGSGGITIASNGSATLTGTYQISSSVTGSPVVASGNITLLGGNGVQQYASIANGATQFPTNGTLVSYGGTNPGNWYLPTTASIGSSFYLQIVPTSGTVGGITASVYTLMSPEISLWAVGGTFTGTYNISNTNSSSGLLATGTLTLGNQTTSPYAYNISSSGGLTYKSNGQFTGISGSGYGNWYAPTTTGIGSSYWINYSTPSISGAGTLNGIAFNTWNSLSAGIGPIVVVGGGGSTTATGTWQISTTSGGTPVVAAGNYTFTG